MALLPFYPWPRSGRRRAPVGDGRSGSDRAAPQGVRRGRWLASGPASCQRQPSGIQGDRESINIATRLDAGGQSPRPRRAGKDAGSPGPARPIRESVAGRAQPAAAHRRWIGRTVCRATGSLARVRAGGVHECTASYRKFANGEQGEIWVQSQVVAVPRTLSQRSLPALLGGAIQ